MKNIIEHWKDIKGYEGMYKISDLGRVWSCHKNDLKEIQEFLKTKYKFVTLFKDGNGKIFSIHRLVAETFIPNPENKPCVDHINTMKDDNRAENLRWCTIKENGNNVLTRKHISIARKGKKMSDETRKKMSEISKQKKGELNNFYGHKHSEEYKNKASARMKEKMSNNEKYKHQLEEYAKIAHKKMFKARKQINPKTNEVIKIWNDYEEFKNSEFNIKCVRRCCQGERDTYKGFKWEYI